MVFFLVGNLPNLNVDFQPVNLNNNPGEELFKIDSKNEFSNCIKKIGSPTFASFLIVNQTNLAISKPTLGGFH